jgi:hypothetical protein
VSANTKIKIDLRSLPYITQKSSDGVIRVANYLPFRLNPNSKYMVLGCQDLGFWQQLVHGHSHRPPFFLLRPMAYTLYYRDNGNLRKLAIHSRDQAVGTHVLATAQTSRVAWNFIHHIFALGRLQQCLWPMVAIRTPSPVTKMQD